MTLVRRRAVLTVLAAFLLASLVVITTGAPTNRKVSAQARLVELYVRSEPPLPQPGDDVTVAVRAVGCEPGTARFDVYLVSDNGTSLSVARVAHAPALSNVTWRARASVTLPDALEGWYGVRVVCGNFQPERQPMANTYFAVGANPNKTSTVDGTEVVDGGSLPMRGTGCPGTQVEYDVRQNDGRVTAFNTLGSFPVADDGSWQGLVEFPDGLKPGKAEVNARCLAGEAEGDPLYVYYGDPRQITILRAANATNEGIAGVTTTVAPVTAPPDTSGR